MIAEAQIETATSFEMRRLAPSDHGALAAMYESFEPRGASLGLPPRKELQKWLDHLAGYPNFVAFLRDRVVGHAVLCPEGGTGEVAVFVHQDYRGLGLGKRLLGEAISEARHLGLSRVWGTTEADNVPMLRLAFSLGFVPGKGVGEFYLELRERTRAQSDLVSAT